MNSYFFRSVLERVATERVQTDLVVLLTTRPAGGNKSDSLAVSSFLLDLASPPAKNAIDMHQCPDYSTLVTGWPLSSQHQIPTFP